MHTPSPTWLELAATARSLIRQGHRAPRPLAPPLQTRAALRRCSGIRGCNSMTFIQQATLQTGAISPQKKNVRRGAAKRNSAWHFSLPQTRAVPTAQAAAAAVATCLPLPALVRVASRASTTMGIAAGSDQPSTRRGQTTLLSATLHRHATLVCSDVGFHPPSRRLWSRLLQWTWLC